MLYIRAGMKLAGRPTIDEFKKKHADCRGPLDAWIADVTTAKWETSQDIKKRFATTSFLGNNRVVFNIKGKQYRLLVKVAYRTGVVAVERIGTHSEYNSWKL
jgi:mRNA interferase HigB